MVILIYHFDNYVFVNEFLRSVLANLLILVKQANFKHELIEKAEQKEEEEKGGQELLEK